MAKVLRSGVTEMAEMIRIIRHVSSRLAQCSMAVLIGSALFVFSTRALALPAFPDAEGYGVETTHGRGGIVVIVTNTNDSGPGSLREALMMTEPRIIIFRTSGTIALKSALTLGAPQSYVAVLGQTAPGDGIALKGPADGPILRLSNRDGSSIFHDGLFQHLRFRHGMPDPALSGQTDNLVITTGTYNVVFDHNSFTWGGDEVISLYRRNIHDVTFSHNLFAEGAVFCREGTNGSLGQNVGPLLSGGSPQWNMTFHHNVLMHMCFRNYKLTTTNGGGSRGIQFINNVHYNNSSQEYSFSQNQYSGSGTLSADVIGDYFKLGPESNPARPFTLMREAQGSFSPMSLHLRGNTWRNLDGSPAKGNNESNNYEIGSMMGLQETHGAPTWEVRNTQISPQPRFAVTTTNADQAYVELIIEENVGAKPSDSVDQRLINDPENGGEWDSSNVPAPHGTGKYPVLSTYGVPADQDNDGVPDDFETVTLGTNPAVYEPQGKLDHDNDGYANIEEWVHSVTENGQRDIGKTVPLPPSNLVAQ